MAKNQNTYEKLRREMDKKRKAQEKRAGKLKRKDDTPRLPELSANATAQDSLASSAARRSMGSTSRSEPLPANGATGTSSKFAAWQRSRSTQDTVEPS
ncbi:MAG: hypothetical protein WD851_09275 [Pirellulales bacterium]